jgi:hypothetical protein
MQLIKTNDNKMKKILRIPTTKKNTISVLTFEQVVFYGTLAENKTKCFYLQRMKIKQVTVKQ